MTVVYADGGNYESIKEMYEYPIVKGFTSNPTLMKKAGITNYKEFVLNVTKIPLPFSFEVLSDEFDEMEKQSRILSSWAENIYVKIPITNTKNVSSIPLIKKLVKDNIKVNITAITKFSMLDEVSTAIGNKDTILSVFAGRISDTGVDPEHVMLMCKAAMRQFPKQQLLWASCREVFNFTQARRSGVDIITMPNDMIKKMVDNTNKPLQTVSLETIKMFYNDGISSGLKIE